MKRINLLAALFVVCLGGFIGFNPNSPSQTLNANTTMIRWVDVPKTPVDVLSLNTKSIDINLKDETVSVNGGVDNTSVTITRDVETRPEYITKKEIVEKVVYLTEDITYRTKFFDRLRPINRVTPVKGW